MVKRFIGKKGKHLEPWLKKVSQKWEERFQVLAEQFKREARQDLTEEVGGLLGKWELKIRDELRPLQEAMLQDIMELIGTGYQGMSCRCACGGLLKYKDNVSAKISTLVGGIRLKRAYYYDSVCQRSYFPLDELLGLSGSKWSPGMRRVMALVGSDGPFERASDLLAEVSGLTVSDDSLQRVTEAAGQELGGREKAERTKRWLEQGSKNEHKRRIYMEVDGGRVPLRAGWREVKLGCIFDGLNSGEGDRRGPTRYFGGIYDELNEFVNIWKQEAQGSGVAQAQELVVIGDGAEWIWNRVVEEFPQAIQILDYYHALEHSSQVAVSVFGENNPEGKAWLKGISERLKDGQLSGVIEELERLKQKIKKARPAIEETIRYYQKNAHRMAYDKYRKKGYFIGSGVIESACRHLSNQRLKIAGARWNKDNANYILQIRIARANRTWDTYWKSYQKSA